MDESVQQTDQWTWQSTLSICRWTLFCSQVQGTASYHSRAGVGNALAWHVQASISPFALSDFVSDPHTEPIRSADACTGFSPAPRERAPKSARAHLRPA